MICLKHKILDILKGSEGYVSGEEISRSLNISRTAVWKHIKTLREDGYEISSSTNRGYRLGQSDVISPEEITAALDTGFIGRSVFCLEETDSTNSECKRHSDYPDGTVFTAEIQTGGRGRRGKEWSSPKGVGAWFSVLLKPDMRPEDVSKITLIAGLAVCRAIGCGAMIKYPNDIVIGSRKVCGILTELSAEIDAVNYIVCGIGINVNTPLFDGELQERATSLFIETGKRHSRARVIAAVLNELEPLYKDFLKHGISNIMDEYRRLCVTLGRDVAVRFGGRTAVGRCTAINDDGSIEIETENGSVTVNSGEVSVRGIYGYI